jgi:hypothetical protein
MYYIANVKSGIIIDMCDSLLEAKEFVFKHTEYIILVKFNV